MRRLSCFLLLALSASPAFAIYVVSTPEPATLALTGIGAAAAVLALKRR